MTTFTLNRRTLLTGTVALGTVGLLAACGGNSSKNETSALSAGDDLSKAVSYNEKDRSALKDGGELRLSADGIGPNFNILNTNGYTAGNLNIQAAINSAFTGGFYADFRGESHMNQDYVTEYKAQTVDGVQTVTFKINPKAAFNDGTPIDTPEMKQAVTQALEAVYPAQAGLFTQALMELGATVCGPNRTPDCPRCPCAAHCLGYAHGTAAALPAKLPKREKRQEEKTVFILQCDGCFALRRRPPKGLLAGLWEFPNVPGTLTPEAAIGLLGDWNLRPSELEKSITRKHIFTHIVWEMRGIYAQVREKAPEFTWMTPGEIDTQAALPTAFRLFWEETEHV